jgi:hypothetical protein
MQVSAWEALGRLPGILEKMELRWGTIVQSQLARARVAAGVGSPVAGSTIGVAMNALMNACVELADVVRYFRRLAGSQRSR